MIKKLSFAAALLAPGLGYGQVSAPPTPPTAAQVAGFTTCIVCMDFTAPSGGVWVNGAATAANAAQTNTWLDCAGARNWVWHRGTNYIVGGPCPDITTHNGTQVLHFQISDNDGPYHNGMKLYNNDTGEGIMAPTNTYYEATYILTSFPLGGYSPGPWVGGTGEIPGNIHNFFEFDAFEIASPVQSSAAISSNLGSWNPNLWGGHRVGPSNWYGTPPPNYDSLNITAQFLKIGQRITSDGVSQYKCVWINDLFQNCVHWPAGFWFDASQLSDEKSRSQIYFSIVQNYDSRFVGTMTGYVKSINLWACSNWQITACNTPENPDPGGY